MKIDDLSLREKILQTVIIKVDKDNFNTEKVGAAFFFGEIITDADEMGLDTARNILKQYSDNADIPILITSDFENGCGSMLKGLTPLPYLMNVGAADDESLAYDYGKATALEARSIGANWSFSPVSDLNINPRNPLVNVRAIGDEPESASRLLKQIARGMQENGLAACVKHFPGDGVDWRDQHIVTTNNTLTTDQWKKMHGRVFQELIDDGVLSVMAGHITLPHYQKETFANGMKLPATLSKELITDLLKGEMGFDGVVVTDALGMGGFNGWYDTKEEAQIEAFKAGCDMLLWPTESYVDDMTRAIESGYIPQERLDDAVSRILRMKERLGLFEHGNTFYALTDEDKKFVADTQQKIADKSVTMVTQAEKLLPIDTSKAKKIAVVPITHHAPAFEEAELLCNELRARGTEVDYFKDGISHEEIDAHDLIIYALFSRPFRPIGFLDFHSGEAWKLLSHLQRGRKKSAIVSFGSPYFGMQYFERAATYVNAYSMLSPSVKAFAKAAFGEIPFGTKSPVKIHSAQM